MPAVIGHAGWEFVEPVMATFSIEPHRTRPSRWVLVILPWLCLTALPARAHESPPPRHCVAPTRPADEQNDVLWQRFLTDVDAFRACISSYVEANNRAADIHRQAAREATMEWNRFVHAELNVPADYPWPPKGPDPQKR